MNVVASLRIGSDEAAALANVLYSSQPDAIDPKQIGSGWRCLALINCHRNFVVRQSVATPCVKPSLHRIGATSISSK